MEESELEEWFNQEKEKLEERFYAEIDARKQDAKERFDADYRKLLAEFQRKQNAIYDQQRRHAALHKPIERYKERVRLVREAIANWYAARKLAIEKWRFDRKIRRILNDRSHYP